MTWAIYCRYNQARSIIAGGLLRKLFPNQEIITGGIHAIDNQAIPASVAEIAHAWSIPEFDRKSHIVDDAFIRNVKPSILAADDLVATSLGEVHPSAEIATLAEFTNDRRLIPIDPTGLSISNLSIELAKVLVLALRWANSKKALTPNISSLLLLENQDSSWQEPQMNLDSANIYIDVDFLIPEEKPWYQNKKAQLFDPRKLDSYEIETSPNSITILRSRFEIDSPESVFTSLSWRAFLFRLAESRNVVLVSSLPLSIVKPTSIPILGMLHSQRTSIWPRLLDKSSHNLLL